MEKVLVVNFGGQYAHLIARRIREVGVYAEIASPEEAVIKASKEEVKAVILSGGPSSVYEPGAPDIDEGIFALSKPVLGICYGHQMIAKKLGGKVERGKGEYGKTIVKILVNDPLFDGWKPEEAVWMSHSDFVEEPPPGFHVLAISENGYIAAMRKGLIYGVQFHPEVHHTSKGRVMFENFLRKIARISDVWRPEDQITRIVEEIRSRVKGGDVIVGVSGGVDSTVTAVLLYKAVGQRVKAVFIDHGLFREGEPEEAASLLKSIGIDVVYIDAKERFLKRLEGVADCEEKRRIIGETFAEVFSDAVKQMPNVKYLAQGTLYPDVVESGAVKGADKIKSHHNVGGLPPWFQLELIEPLREFYKDEVRRIAKALGLPEDVVYRHPFPGPGLAVRIIGPFTREKLAIVRKATKIVEEELRKAGLFRKVWQAFATVGEDKWVGVKGDRRAMGYIVTVRIVESEDAMTADWSRIPFEILEKISSRITSEIPEVTMVTYAVTSKPPSTIEPC
ncbi:GMP synthetase (glutamine-hydrolysing) [Pyrobaculum aerophilum str. IM2]|uniref:GMP synthase [glutamine-hydrolyzing] n=2 Tax=Pyrobaculum aerophilum TaxID=13773 RepID=GUAA_PYRAE|nr:MULTISPECIES: glutamine-hydrolyzing GMP synthase [Pyrobaculum]Q8ZT92.1 RecName: Full=GMP synthase [glutamine-hydrolyzing]; AltName: Full=GMP synthetase; AltName: Full=Glutamine amidotransferase [Pyrobaculum aerophilum str. IM2]AAL64871.1 GMP synthetase (glutamine-hydrolysing) [Pyrobaculum aerophilum str. IM2]HII47518.1 glutamine-hydrolyzing GMP synthase [Pyrobaculum aerophilum]